MLLDVLAPWIIDSWLEILSALSFDIPTLQLDRYQQHIAVAASAIILLAMGWHSVGKIPLKTRLPILVLLTLTMLAPFAILTAVHLDEISQLPPFDGHVRKQANAEPAIQTQRLPPAVALPESTQPAVTSIKPSPVPDVLAATTQQPSTLSAHEVPSTPPATIAASTNAQPPPAATTTTASTAIRRVATNLSRILPGAAKTELMPVFYGTNRLTGQSASPHPAYTAAPSPTLELGRAFIQIPRHHQHKQGDRPWVAALPQSDISAMEVANSPGVDLDKQFAIASLKPLSRDGFLEQTVMRLASSQRYKDHALVFIPGFNTSFEASLYRAAQLAYDLKFDGAPFVYSWPSDGTSPNYKHDSEAVAKTSAYFTEFLRVVISQSNAKSISIIAHGLGTKLTLDGLIAMKDNIPEGVTIRELILTAPDMDAASFKERIAALSGIANRTTLYVASTDRALNISRRYTGGVPRAGDLLSGGPLILQGVDTVDVSLPGTQAFGLNHPDYVDQTALIRDIASRLENPTREQSAALESIPTPSGPYHRLR